MTLKLVARYADMNNVGGGIENVRRKEEILLRHCETVGRDPSEIERTTGIGTVFIRDDRAEAERLFHAAFDRNRVAKHWIDQPVGTVEDVVEHLTPYVELGYHHLIAGHARGLRRGVDDPVRDRGPAAAPAALGHAPRPAVARDLHRLARICVPCRAWQTDWPTWPARSA